MARRYTIGQLGSAADVPTTTVRYYERRGLLPRPARTGSGAYRSYGEEDLERLRFIRAAQTIGLTLADARTLLGLRDGVTDPCREVQDLIRERLGEVAARAKDLRRVERVLKASLRLCRQVKRSGRCQTIDTLIDGAGTRTRE